jgi:hypothetical protein
MTVPNAGSHHPDPADPEVMNSALVYRDEHMSGDMEAATTRAATVSHRFGGVRYALTRSDSNPPAEHDPNDGGDPDASH